MKPSSSTPLIAVALEEALRKLDNTVKDESARRLNVQILLLKKDNDSLQSQLNDSVTWHTQQEQQLLALEQQRFQLTQTLEHQKTTVQVLERQLLAEQKVARNATEASCSISDNESRLRDQLQNSQSTIDSQKREASKAHKDAQMEIKFLRTQSQDSTVELDLLRSQLKSTETASKSARLVNTSLEELTATVDSQAKELTHCRSALEESELSNQRLQTDAAKQEALFETRSAVFEAQIEELSTELGTAKAALKDCRTELAQERRANKRSTQSKGQDSAVDNQMESLQTSLETVRSELKECQSELADELRMADQTRKETQKVMRASKSREAELDSKIELLKAKLQSLKEQLSESRADLILARQTIAVQSNGPKTVKEPRKTFTREMTTDHTLGTPDGVAARGKKTSMRDRLDQTTIGEKSMFSITPYLNRTANITTASPGSEVRLQQPELMKEMSRSPDIIVKPPVLSTLEQVVPVQSKTVALKETKAATQNQKSTKRPLKRYPKLVSALNDVEEEVDENEEPESCETQTVTRTHVDSTAKESDNHESKKIKKRKLLGGGKTLFDDEDGEGGKRLGPKAALGPGRSLVKGSIGLKGSLKSARAGMNGSGGFSPLKKDRRGVNASFLG